MAKDYVPDITIKQAQRRREDKLFRRRMWYFFFAFVFMMFMLWVKELLWS